MNITIPAYQACNTNTWYHCAVSRQGSNTRVFLNGTLQYNAQGSTGPDGAVQNSTIGIGTCASTSLNGGMIGYIDDVRIVAGTAMYTQNFTPPTTELTKTNQLN